MKQCLFVYGTLGQGRPNEHILTAIGGAWEEATVRGHLKEQGWGAEMGYPGIVLDDAGDIIRGFIFCTDNLHDHWDELDEFEGEEYRRISAKVQKNNKSTTEAQIYVLELVTKKCKKKLNPRYDYRPLRALSAVSEVFLFLRAASKNTNVRKHLS